MLECFINKTKPFNVFYNTENKKNIIKFKGNLGEYYAILKKPQLDKITNGLNFFILENKKLTTYTHIKEDNILFNTKWFRNIQTSVDQGYTLHLELKGTGFKAEYTTEQNPINNIKKVKQMTNKGTLEKITKNILYTKELHISKTEQKHNLLLYIGHSHPILYNKLKQKIKIKIVTPTTIMLFGLTKAAVHQLAAQLNSKNKPDPYKGKGIHYQGKKIYASTLKKRKADSF